MFVATKDKPLATTITGSLPRPSWYRENLHGRAFSRAMLGVLEHDDRIDPVPACRALGLELTPLDETLRRSLEPPRGR